MLQILTGDCMEILPTLAAQSVQCCVTSPPYWGLRDYGTSSWEGGDAGCEHTTTRRGHGDEKQSTSHGTSRDSLAGLTECRTCGARRIDSQLGLEATPEEYLTKMVAVFREVWRVLRDDGTLWVNMGDSYSQVATARGHPYQRHSPVRSQGWEGTKLAKREIGRNQVTPKMNCDLKPKDLCGIPWRLAFALQADGWYLRSDIIWHKPNPMPESVTDRPTKSHEYIFLLAKQERYFYDAEAIREQSIRAGDIPGGIGGFINHLTGGHNKDGLKANGMKPVLEYRNKRSVWTIATQPYAEAHFATFPEDLIKPCIMAGSRVGDTVLDPFCGSGTTGNVALELGRKAVLIELNPEYVELAEERCRVTPGMI